MLKKGATTALGRLQSAIQLAGFHYIVCLKARPTSADHRLKFERTEFSFKSISETENNTLHFEFQRWAAAAVLRDLMESFSIFLAEVYEGIIQANPKVTYSVSFAKFERCGIEEQLDILSQNFGIDQRWVTTLVGFNRMRNCLAHRQGKVGVRDCTDGDDLVVSWLVSNITLTDGPEKGWVEDDGYMSGLMAAKKSFGAAAEFKTQIKEKRFELGSILNFHPQDIFEICGTIHQASIIYSTICRSAMKNSCGDE